MFEFIKKKSKNLSQVVITKDDNDKTRIFINGKEVQKIELWISNKTIKIY